jgi:hypothetical protein
MMIKPHYPPIDPVSSVDILILLAKLGICFLITEFCLYQHFLHLGAMNAAIDGKGEDEDRYSSW